MRANRYHWLALLALLASVGTSSAETVTVTIGTDPIDIDWQTATIEDLPGPDGEVSFSEAMIATNNTPGHDTIGFAIPESEWSFQFLFPGRAVIWSSYTYFWRASDQVSIDGTTQTEFTGDTNPDGAEVVLYGDEVYLNADGCTLLGLDSGAVTFSGSNGHAHGNTGGIHLTFFGGGGGLIEGNDGGTLKIDRSSDNVVVGNTFVRIRVLGGGPSATNNRIGGPNPEDRNFLTGYGYVNSEGLPSGTTLQLFDTVDLLVENNWIGTTPDGMAQGSLDSTVGIGFEGENHGGVIRNNRIAGILGHGQGPHHAGQLFGWAIMIGGSGSNLTFVGNTVGLNASGEPVLGSVWGIDVGTWNYSGIDGIRIGGPGPGEGNVVAGHIFNGITVGRTVASVRLSANSIYANESLGIDLIPTGYGYGVTPNDPLDSDTGGNGLQNFPEIESVTREGAILHIIGTLRSSPSDLFTIEFYVSPECDGSGFGEGQKYIGSTSISTDAAGDANLGIWIPALVEEGWVLSATATLEPAGATSEFSACVMVTGDLPSSVGNGLLDERSGLRLAQGRPNPFRLDTTIRFDLPRAAEVLLGVFDVNGRRVRTLRRGHLPAGSHSVGWDGRSDAGEPVGGGVYYCRLLVDGQTLTKHVTLTR